MAKPLRLSQKELRNVFIASVVVGMAFAAYNGVTEPVRILGYLGMGFVPVIARELGQRVTARGMNAEVNLEISRNGAFVTLITAAFSYVASFNFMVLFPVVSEFSVTGYEHWGKSIDAMWSKREYWLVSMGILGLFGAWILSYSFGFRDVAELVSLFTFFQLLPLDHEKGICGDLDGTSIMLWSGFMWAIFVGITIIMMILSVL